MDQIELEGLRLRCMEIADLKFGDEESRKSKKETWIYCEGFKNGINYAKKILLELNNPQGGKL